jgi:hypothetical protein
MSVADFNNATMAETLTYITARQAARENDDRNNAEWVRWLAAHVRNANPYLKKAIQPKDLITFPDEKVSTPMKRELTEHDKFIFEKMQRAALKFHENKKK